MTKTIKLEQKQIEDLLRAWITTNIDIEQEDWKNIKNKLVKALEK